MKYLLIGFNSLLIFIFSLFNGGARVTLSHNIPSAVATGIETPVEIVVTKGNLEGFGSLQIIIPDGIRIDQEDDHGAIFSFQNGVARWVWISVPKEQRFSVKMRMIVSDGFTGLETLKARYLFIENNSKREVEMPPVEVNNPEVQQSDSPYRTLKPIAARLEAMDESTLLDDHGVKVAHNIPPIMRVGQPTNVEITVSKGELNGFAKLQLTIPEGLSVTQAEEGGAIYSFEEGTAKWVWAALPEEEKMVVKFTLLASEITQTEYTVTGKYYFVDNNEKQEVEMPPAAITILAPEAVSTAVPTVDDTTSATRLAAEKRLDSLITEGTGNAEPDGLVTGSREVTKKEGGEYIVTVTINKDNTRGFARYSENIPSSVKVMPIQTDGSSFSLSDGKLKFVWVNVPVKQVLDISYSLSAAGHTTLQLAGEYSYLEQNQSKKYKFAPEAIIFDGNKPVREATKIPSKKAEPLLSGGNSSTRVIYHVQVGAFKKKISADKLVTRFKIKEKVSSEMQGGFSKFMVGNFGEYRVARDHREEIIEGNGIKSAFVVAYNHGKRITVQEALMITNQKWFK